MPYEILVLVMTTEKAMQIRRMFLFCDPTALLSSLSAMVIDHHQVVPRLESLPISTHHLAALAAIITQAMVNSRHHRLHHSEARRDPSSHVKASMTAKGVQGNERQETARKTTNAVCLSTT